MKEPIRLRQDASNKGSPTVVHPGAAPPFTLTFRGPGGAVFQHLDATEEEHLRCILNARAFAAVDAIEVPSRIGKTLRRDQVKPGEFFRHVDGSVVFLALGSRRLWSGEPECENLLGVRAVTYKGAMVEIVAKPEGWPT